MGLWAVAYGVSSQVYPQHTGSCFSGWAPMASLWAGGAVPRGALGGASLPVSCNLPLLPPLAPPSVSRHAGSFCPAASWSRPRNSCNPDRDHLGPSQWEGGAPQMGPRGSQDSPSSRCQGSRGTAGGLREALRQLGLGPALPLPRCCPLLAVQLGQVPEPRPPVTEVVIILVFVCQAGQDGAQRPAN